MPIPASEPKVLILALIKDNWIAANIAGTLTPAFHTGWWNPKSTAPQVQFPGCDAACQRESGYGALARARRGRGVSGWASAAGRRADRRGLMRDAGMNTRIFPIKGYTMTFPVAGAQGAPTMGGMDEEALIAWSRLGDRVRFTATAEFSGYDTTHKPGDFSHMKAVARELFPDGGDVGQATYWACLRPMTPDGPPIIGRGRLENLWLNTGHGHMGWTMACGSARIVADLIQGHAASTDIRGMGVR